MSIEDMSIPLSCYKTGRVFLTSIVLLNDALNRYGLQARHKDIFGKTMSNKIKTVTIDQMIEVLPPNEQLLVKRLRALGMMVAKDRWTLS